MTLYRVLVCLLGLSWAACGSDSNNGSNAVEGAAAGGDGGASTASSTNATGGRRRTAEGTSIGGTTSAGDGAVDRGGSSSTGVLSTTGGSSSTGGPSTTGGSSSTGGVVGSAGSSNTDGPPATGGFSGTGGAVGSAGSSSTGGPPATGGSSTSGSCQNDGSEPTATVSSGSELNEAIASASPGAVIWMTAGDYSCVEIEGEDFTREAPLILRKSPNETGEVTFTSGGCYFNTRIANSSYIALDGVTVDGGGAAVWVEASSHVILRNLTVTNPDQEGIRLRWSSSYVDVINCHIFSTGQTNPHYGECIYVGTGGDEDFPDQTEHIWLENNEIHNCGAAEGINIKPEAFHVTARGNSIHDIAPGTPDQYNQSALTVEGAGRETNHRPTDPRDVWLENNTVAGVTFGEWASGIMVGGTGVFVVGNTVTDYEEWGIYVNGFGDLGLPVYLFENEVDDSGQGTLSRESGMDIREVDPGPNPNAPQDWYCP